MTDRLPAIEPSIRDLIAAVREHVDHVMHDVLRMGIQPNEAATNVYAAACMKDMPQRLSELVAAHDALGAALNVECPGVNPVVSLSTEGSA